MTFGMLAGIIIGNGEKDQDREYLRIGNGTSDWDQLQDRQFIIC
jgi:hypothetical protein